MPKLNCWEFKKCGRELDGVNAKELGVCPAATETKAHGLHEGLNAGRVCWIIAGTLCNGKIQGTFAHKIGNCKTCDFYIHVITGEREKFKSVEAINEILNKR